MRKSYRNFRADRIKSMTDTGEVFEPRSTLSLQEHFQSMFNENQSLLKVVAIFEKSALRGRSLYGSTLQEDLGDRIRSEFMVDHLDYMAHWLLLFGSSVEIVEPQELKMKMQNIAKELYNHYNIHEAVAQS
jgi:predicted DNA-binding transcriptional regulator YafY